MVGDTRQLTIIEESFQEKLASGLYQIPTHTEEISLRIENTQKPSIEPIHKQVPLPEYSFPKKLALVKPMQTEDVKLMN